MFVSGQIRLVVEMNIPGGSQTLLVEGRGKGLVNYLQFARIHGCIPAISVDEGKKCHVGQPDFEFNY